MERKRASEYPQELLDLFHEYQHGDITRREFLDRAKTFGVGGLTVMAIWESLKPNYAWAEQIPKDDIRITVGYQTVQSPEGNGRSRATSLARQTLAASYPPCSSSTRTAASIRTSRMWRDVSASPISWRLPRTG